MLSVLLNVILLFVDVWKVLKVMLLLDVQRLIIVVNKFVIVLLFVSTRALLMSVNVHLTRILVLPMVNLAVVVQMNVQTAILIVHQVLFVNQMPLVCLCVKIHAKRMMPVVQIQFVLFKIVKLFVNVWPVSLVIHVNQEEVAQELLPNVIMNWIVLWVLFVILENVVHHVMPAEIVVLMRNVHLEDVFKLVELMPIVNLAKFVIQLVFVKLVAVKTVTALTVKHAC